MKCAVCGCGRYSNEVHLPHQHGALTIREIIASMRHDGCGGRPGRVELVTAIESISSRPVRRIVLLGQSLRQVIRCHQARPVAEAARLFGDAVHRQTEDFTSLVQLTAMVERMRLGAAGQ